LTSHHPTIGLIGAGAMGRALAAGIVRGHPELAETLRIADSVPAAEARVCTMLFSTMEWLAK